MKKLTFLILLALVAGILGADPTDTRYNDKNPAFFANGHRFFLELGVTPAEIKFQNSYMGIGEVIALLNAKQLDLDFGKIVKELGTGGWQYQLDADLFRTHLALQIGPLGLGAYATTENFFASALPTSLFDLFNSGWELDKTVSGKADVYLQSYLKGGLFATWKLSRTYLFGLFNLENYVLGGKLGTYAPLLYADNASFGYNFRAGSDGKITFDAGAAFPLYTSIPVDQIKNPDGTVDFSRAGGVFSNGLNSSRGYYADFGVAYKDPKTGKMLFGASLLNFPLLPARPAGKMAFNGTVTAVIDDILGNYEDISKAITSNTVTEVKASTGGDKSIFLPMTVAGFYRLPVLPILSVIGDGALVLPVNSPTQLRLVGTGDLNLFNVLDFTMGLGAEYTFGANQIFSRYSLNSSLGLNLYIVEVMVNASLTGPSPVSLGRGLSAGVFVAMGF